MSSSNFVQTNRSSSPLFRRLIGAIVVVMVISMTGCATMKGKPEGESSSFMPDWGSALRIPPPNSELNGLSDTSRQIERNLGYE